MPGSLEQEVPGPAAHNGGVVAEGQAAVASPEEGGGATAGESRRPLEAGSGRGLELPEGRHLVRFIGTSDLQNCKMIIFEATASVVICHSSSGKLMHRPCHSWVAQRSRIISGFPIICGH